MIRESEPVERRRILVIDDDADHAEIVARLLERRGFLVDRAPDAATGLALAQRDPPAAIVLDLFMPRLDGLSAAALLQGDLRTQNVPIVFLSACGPRTARAAGLAGRPNYLPKPFRADDLIERLMAALAPPLASAAP